MMLLIYCEICLLFFEKSPSVKKKLYKIGFLHNYEIINTE